MWATGGQGPMLQGLRILDLTSVVFGPYATRILADLGAEVIKIEPPEGDIFRYSAKAAKTLGMSPGFLALNRGKKSVVLDLKQDSDRERLHTLAAGADCVIHNIRAQAAERLGLDYASMKALRADIVHVHCTGFARNGPYADLQAYDDVIQAASGVTTLLSRVDGDPRPRYIPSLIADKVAGLHAAYAVLAGLVHRLRTGEGQAIEVPMMEAFSSFMLVEHLGGLAFDPPVGPVGYARQIDPNRQPFPTKDGWISIVPYHDRSMRTLFDLLEAPERLEEPELSTPKLRARNISLLYAVVGELTPNFTTDEILRRCRAAEVPAMPVRDMADMLREPQLSASGLLEAREHPTEGRVVDIGQPVRFEKYAPAAPCLAPHLGEHSLSAEALAVSPPPSEGL